MRAGRRLRTRARLRACDAREPQAECTRCREGMPKARWGKCTRDGHHLGTKYGHGRVFAVDDGPAVDLMRHSLSLLLALDVLCAVAAIPLEGAAALKVEAMRRPLGGFRREVSEAAQKLVERGGLVRPAGVPQESASAHDRGTREPWQRAAPVDLALHEPGLPPSPPLVHLVFAYHPSAHTCASSAHISPGSRLISALGRGGLWLGQSSASERGGLRGARNRR